jgi:hypothetical protein
VTPASKIGIVVALLAATACGRVGYDSAEVDDDADTTPIDPSLVVWYKADDSPTDGALDSSSHGLDGACGASCPALVTGIDGQAYLFNGTSDLITVGHDSQLNTTSEFTATLWFNADSFPARVSLFAMPHDGGGNNTWQLAFESDGRLVFVTTDGSTNQRLIATPSYTFGSWAHLAGRWDGTTQTVFFNGAPVATSTDSVLFVTDPLTIGGDLNSNSPAILFPGTLDELRLYDRALSDVEVLALATP